MKFNTEVYLHWEHERLGLGLYEARVELDLRHLDGRDLPLDFASKRRPCVIHHDRDVATRLDVEWYGSLAVFYAEAPIEKHSENLSYNTD